MKKNILVTGGAGYIGTHTVVELINSGYDVIVTDNFSNSDKRGLQGVEEILGRSIIVETVDCCNKNAFEEIFKKYKFNSVIHFAGLKSVGESVQQPLKYYYNNLVSTINTLDLMQQYGVKNIIFSSSATVYGQPDELPATEQTPIQKSSSPYGITKQVGEMIIEDVTNLGKVNSICLRYFNPVGAHNSALIGELPQGIPNNLVPFITQTAAGVREQLSVFGGDYDTPDGTALRDYIDVVDLAKAHVAAVARLVDENNASSLEFYNIGTGIPLSVLELVTKFEEVNDLKLNYTITGRREGDIEKVWADTTLANEVLDWKAQNPIEQTLRNAWLWEKKIRDISDSDSK